MRVKVHSNLELYRVTALMSNIFLFLYFSSTSMDCILLGKVGVITEGLMQFTSAALLFLRYFAHT
jgi:hypothetical protein